MSVSRYDLPSNQPLIDTYVPLPFSEMKEALNEKQQEYDSQQLKLDSSDKNIKGILPNVSETYKDSKGNDVANPHYEKLKYYNNLLDNKKQEIFNKYKNDLTSSEAKSEISNFARSASNIYNEVAPDALNTESAYKESKKRLDEMKGEDQGHRKLEFDKSLYSLSDKKTNKLNSSIVPDEHKFEDLDKNFLEGFKADVTDKVGTYIDKGIYSKVDFGKKVKELTEKEISQRYNDFYKTNHLPVVEKSADYDIEHIFRQKQKNNPELTKEDFNNTKSIKLNNDKAYTPEEYKKLVIEDDKSRRLNQAKRYAFKEEDKSLSSSFLPGIDLGTTNEDGNVGYTPTPPVDTDLVNFKYDSDKLKNLSFKDYIKTQNIDSRVQAAKKVGAAGNVYLEPVLYNTETGKELSTKEHSNLRSQYQTIKDIDKLSNTEFIDKLSEVNPIAKAIKTQVGTNIPKKELLDRLKVIENTKNISGVAINLREAEADNQWYSLFGKKDQGSFNNAKSLKWTDRNTGESLNFDSIEIDGKKIKDLDPSEIIEYKKEGRIGIPKFEYPIASKGGQSVDIDGKTYVTGGETFREKAELNPMATVNNLIRKPLEVANNKGYGEKYHYKPNEIDPYISKEYNIKPASIQGYTDYKTMQNYVIIYNENNDPIGKIPLDEYNKGVIQEVGSGFVQPEKIKGLD